MAYSKNLHTPAAKIKMTLAEKMRAHREYYDGLNEIGDIFKTHTRPPIRSFNYLLFWIYISLKQVRPYLTLSNDAICQVVNKNRLLRRNHSGITPVIDGSPTHAERFRRRADVTDMLRDAV